MSALTVAGGWGPMSSLDRVFNALSDGGFQPTGRKRHFMALCPVHAEKTGSLSVDWKPRNGNGLVLLNCHGCDATTEEIAAALGLGMVDLYDNPPPERPLDAPRVGRSVRSRQAGKRRGKLGPLPKRRTAPVLDHAHEFLEVDRYPYTDVDGTIVQEVVRQQCRVCGAKNFPQTYAWPDGHMHGKKPEDFAPVLYRMPELAAALAAGEEVWLLEGEKDVHTAESLGLVATTNTGGGGSFPDALAPLFAGAVVNVVLDCDATGWERGLTAHEVIAGAGARVLTWVPAITSAKADFTDHVEAGLGVDDLVAIDVDELRVRKALAKLEEVLDKLTVAQDEIEFHLAEANNRSTSAPKAADEARRLAERWVVETELRWESLVDAADLVASAARADGAESVEEAHRLAERIVEQAAVLVRSAHDTLERPLPSDFDDRLSAARSALRSQDGASVSATADAIPAGEAHTAPEHDDAPGAQILDFPGAGGSGGGGGARPMRAVTERKEYRYVAREEDGRVVLSEVKKSAGGHLRFPQVIGIDLHLDGREYVDDTSDIEDEIHQVLAGQHVEVAASPIANERKVSHYLFSYTDPASGERVRFRVEADRAMSGDFLDNIHVPGLEYGHTKSAKQRVLEAVRAVSQDSRDVVQYRGTGWRRDPDLGWVYVNYTGLIGSDGVHPGHQLLQGALKRYALPQPSTDANELREFFLEHSGPAFMTRFAPRIGAVLCGHAFVAPIRRNPYSVVVVGSPGSMKTGLCALAMHHYGSAWDRTRPTVSMTEQGATAIATAIIANQARDAMALFDDVTPGGNSSAAQAKLGAMLQMMFNQSERTRSERTGADLREAPIPHATVLFSSELMPKFGANARRALIVPLQRHELELQAILDLDRAPSRIARATLTSSMLSWAARDLPRARQIVHEASARYAETVRAAGRTPEEADAAANLWGGWTVMTTFLEEIGALRREEVTKVLEQVHEGLFSALDAAQDPDSPTNAGARLRELIASGLRMGVGHVVDIRTGDAPEDDGLAIRLGWRRVNLGPGFQGDPPKFRVEASGRFIGYVNTDADELVLESTALEAFVKAAAGGLSEPFSMDVATVRRALHEVDVLKAQWDKHGKIGGRWRYTMKRKIYCETHATDASRSSERPMTVLRLSTLLGDGPEEGTVLPPAPLPPAPDDEPTAPTTDDHGPQADPAPAEHAQPTLAEAAAPQEAPHDEEAEMRSATPPTVDVLVGVEPTATPGRCFLCRQPAHTAIGGDHVHDQCWRSYWVELPAPAPCYVCDGPTPRSADGQPLHVTCWQLLCSDPELLEATVARHQATTEPTSTSTPEPVSTPSTPPASSLPVEPPTAQTKPQTTRTHRPASATARPTHAAAVVDVDVLHLPDGTTQPAPTIEHLGDLAQLAYDLRLGTQVVPGSDGWRGRRDPGVVVATERLARALGIDPDVALNADVSKRNSAFGEAHRAHPAITAALAAGWVTPHPEGSEPEVQLWTKLYRPEQDSVLVTFMPLLGATLLSGDASAAQVARRLGEYSRLTGAGWHLSPHATGLDLMAHLRRGRAEEFARTTVPDVARRIGDPDLNWCRPPSAEESGMTYVHAYDRGGSYLAGVAGLELPVGEFEAFPEGRAFDASLPGYWKIRMPEAGDWRHPHPLFKLRKREVDWVTTPALAYARELEYEPEILEAVVWPQHARILDPWYARMRDARTAADVPGDADLAVVRSMIKETYTQSIGMLTSHHVEDKAIYAPQRRHMIVAKARTNLLRAVVRIGNETGQWPLAVQTDTVVYASDEPDAEKAWPGQLLARPVKYGRGLGQFKHEGTGTLQDQLPFLEEHGAIWHRDAKRLITGAPEPGAE